ncbi:disks large-associated protein 5-like isoform X1 [Monodelphis domestica]|uniref:disks large-associated protein 5-like isoform X1 n=2 Tax=Monodelphis domestica TaxID=13616 RepID=UPI0004431E98|nr:disks large-associated protein 5-like isoform X1 [Monodelphis domestica]
MVGGRRSQDISCWNLILVQVPTCYKMDASTEMIKIKVAHQKSVSWKENRHKKYEHFRHFPLIDDNATILEKRNLTQLEETNENLQEKDNDMPQSTSSSQHQLLSQRKEMLQRYKKQKQLQKMKERRERTKRGIFKVGLYRPDPPKFLSSLPEQKMGKPEAKKKIPSSARC